MNTFTPKNYQQSALNSIEQYFRTCRSMGNADYAFQETTKELWGRKSAFTPLTGFPEDMPYFCLRIPTGGGKTFLAAKSVALVNNHLLFNEHGVILWLVPSKAIRDQTLAGLRNREHPYHAALREAGPVSVLSLEEAKDLSRSTLDTSTVVIVATRQAFQVENEENRKVYESSGSLMPLFSDLTEEQKDDLLKDADGTLPFSLANALRLRRPFVIVDEAHNSRTELAFDTLAKFKPAGIMELTATPDTEKTPSNVLHAVSAVELKREQMIKLPIELEVEADEQRCLNLAINQREMLSQAAIQEQREGAPYLRPLVLIQSEPKSKTKETRHAEWVKNELMSNHNIPAEEIVIATGSERGLEALAEEFDGGIFSENCPVKFVITQKALAEGWDCAFAYVLVSLAGIRSATAVEQLLGRILRQPQAAHRTTEALNRSYAFVVSHDFGETAAALRDSLVQTAGFNRHDAAEFVAALKPEQAKLDLSSGRIRFTPVEVKVSEELNLSAISRPTRRKLNWNKKDKTLTFTAPLSEAETLEVQTAAIMDSSRETIATAGAASRNEAVKIFHTPSEKGLAFRVPQLEVMIDGELRIFDEPEALDYPWELPLYQAGITESQLAKLNGGGKIAEAGLIDIDEEKGRVQTRFTLELTRDLGLSYHPEHWDEAKLAAWFCRQLNDPYITHASKRAFVAQWITSLLEQGGLDLAAVNRKKFDLRNLLEERINELRKEAVHTAYQQFLFTDNVNDRVRVGSEYHFEFHPDAYAPSRVDEGEFGDYVFEHHFYPRIGSFDSGEEYQCACWLDRQPEIEFWVRNLVGKNEASFFLQTATKKFYPDFVCKLKDGRILIVEYKGADRWNNAEPDRLVGQLWEELSDGTGLFVMVTEKRWADIRAKF
ncbi:DEAD/DEAH box helicase [Pontiella agarivorans]|uniref:DEAD/DEAH box helicase family protein n=1 Tax=Pontiella agarivorans TaxID=3038953 RepID=A0ABU5MV54_9BACT|nr:DEAD/DEAH box helicase family protein [Pontiella agarivorans]MDZ8118094.1 DEAD/DEAH box helicase family protein [Pontiella agarivorans]